MTSKATTTSIADKRTKTFKRNAFLILGLAVACMGLYGYSFYMTLSLDVIKMLVEVIILFAGLFGTIAIYMLESLESRIDRLREKIDYYKTTTEHSTKNQVAKLAKIRQNK